MSVSIISRVTTEHLDDEQFAELWTNAAAEGQPVAHPHLQECAECRLRFASFRSWLDELRVEAIAEAEDAIPAERLGLAARTRRRPQARLPRPVRSAPAAARRRR